MKDSVDEYFCDDYESCRRLFLSSGKKVGRIDSYINPLRGPGDCELATDTLLIGSEDAENVMIVISGTHGLEGLAGSGIQIGLMDRLQLGELANTSILFVHALNPWGMAYSRRQNEDNVDLNRNFLEFPNRGVKNSDYERLHSIALVPDLFVNGERNPSVVESIADYRRTYGDAAYHRALFQGQTTHPTGIGYCGAKPTWSNTTVREICGRFGRSMRNVAILDLHTGLGPYGKGEILANCEIGSERASLLRRWLDDDFVAVQSNKAMPYVPIGEMASALTVALDDRSQVIAAALEFGTFDVSDLMRLQIDDAWLQIYGDSTSAIGQSIKKELRGFFYPPSRQWKERVLFRAEQLVSRLLRTLASA